MSKEYRLGEPILDDRYVGNDFIGESIVTMPYTPNQEWVAPIYHPFTINDLVAIHLTDQDARDSGELQPHSYIPFQTGPENKWVTSRETLHFTLNGVADDHSGGQISPTVYSWKNKRFAYVIPLKDIYGQVISLFTHDTIAVGKIALPASAVVIEDQERVKILEAVANLGYQPLDIRGVKPLDPAYLLGTKTNVNHSLNFSSMINDLVDGCYTAASINNILVLDNLLTSVLQYMSTGNAVIDISEELIDDINQRVNFFVVRYGEDEKRGGAIDRLQRIARLYDKCLRDYLLYQQEFDAVLKSAQNLPDEEYDATMKLYKEKKLNIRNMLKWENAQI